MSPLPATEFPTLSSGRTFLTSQAHSISRPNRPHLPTNKLPPFPQSSSLLLHQRPSIPVKSEECTLLKIYLRSKFELRVQTDGEKTPREVLVQACRDLVNDLGTLSREFTKEWELRKMAGEGTNGVEK